MPEIVYVEPDGTRNAVAVPEGATVKDAALEHGIDGIVAECGGNAMCATCHVYVAAGWAARLPELTEVEDELLMNVASPRRDTSRLSCQLVIGADLDGLVVHIPAVQA
jgi:2Fe-2S ferredoxin